MKKENKSRYKVAEQLNSKTSSLLIVVSCISVLMLMIYFGVSVTSKGTFSAATPTCPTGTSLKTVGSVTVCCDNSYSNEKQINQYNSVFTSLALSNIICANSKYVFSTGTTNSTNAYDVQSNEGRCKTSEIAGVSDAGGCAAMGNTTFDATTNTCYMLEVCAISPVSPECQSGWVSADGTTCIDDSTSTTTTTTQAATQYSITLHANGGKFLVNGTDTLVRYCPNSSCDVPVPDFSTKPSGKKFGGWSQLANSPSGISIITINSSTNGKTFYAIWVDDDSPTGNDCPSDGTLLTDGKTCSVQCGTSTLDQCNAAFNNQCEVGGISGITCYTCRNGLGSDYGVVNKECVQTSNNPIQTFTITFDANVYDGTALFDNGLSVEEKTCTTTQTSSSCAITAPTISRSGFTFKGWNTNKDASSGYSVTAASISKTYYAIWQQNVNCVYSDPYVSSTITDVYPNGAVFIDVTSGDTVCCGMGSNALNVPGGRGFAPSVWNVNELWKTNASSSIKRCETLITYFEYNGTKYLRHLIGNNKCADGYHRLTDNSKWCVQDICNCDSNCFDDIVGTRCNLSNGKKVTVLTCSMTSDEISGITCSSLNDTAQGTCKVNENGVTKSVLRCSLGAENNSACNGSTPPVTTTVTTPSGTVPKTCYRCEGMNIVPYTVYLYPNERCEDREGGLGIGPFSSNDVSQCKKTCYTCEGTTVVEKYVAAGIGDVCASNGYEQNASNLVCTKTCWYCDGPDKKSTTIASDESCTSHNLKNSKSELNCSSDKKTCYHCVGTSADPVEIDASDKCSNHNGYAENASDLVCTKTCWYCDGPDKKSVKIAKDKACSSKGSGYKDNKNDLTCTTDTPSESKCCACDGKTKVTKGDTTDGKCPSGQTLCSELVCTNSQTGTGAIVIAWIVGLAAIGYSFYYFRRTNKQ